MAPASIRLAGELADGWLPLLVLYSRIAEGAREIQAGASRGGRADRLPVVCPYIPTVISENRAEAREGAAWFVAFYLTTMGPLYQRALRRQGFEAEVQAIHDANPTRDTAVVPSSTENLLEQLTIFGTPAEARRQLRA